MITNRLIIIIATIVGSLSLLCATSVSAATARDKYGLAEGAYKRLIKNTKRQKYRDQWINCIEKFQDVYRHAPSGPWAAAGLYMSGSIYWALYQKSLKTSDKQEAVDHLNRIIKRFPRSQYNKKARAVLKAIAKSETTDKSSKKEAVDEKIETARGDPSDEEKNPAVAKKKYIQAENCYRALLKNLDKQAYRNSWVSCIKQFQGAYLYDPNGPWAAAGLFMTGQLYVDLHQHSGARRDKEKAIENFEWIISHYPNSLYHLKAVDRLDTLYSAEYQKSGVKDADTVSSILGELDEKKHTGTAVSKYPKDGTVRMGSQVSANGICTITGLRYWSNPSYTRIVIDANKKTVFNHRLLKKDPSINKPQRLYVDLLNSRLDKETQKEIPINDNLLIDARAGQYTSNSVRVVADIKSFKSYKIFSLKDPFRIVIDVWGKTLTKSTANKVIPESVKKGDGIGKGALAKQLALGVKRIVIDPGHGGKDYGAPGYIKRVHEKNLSLKIGKILAEKIRRQLRCEVYLTRTTDRYLTLEERTAFANTKNADLFISIHTNSARNRQAYGIETYFLNLATDEESILVAARENATSRKNISDLQTILNDLMQHAKINESSRLAAHVQSMLFDNLKKKYSRIKNKGVKQAPFYVLLGARMPSILVETSFISNPRECKRLTDIKYQNHLADAIINGIRKYVHETHPTSLGIRYSGVQKQG